MEKTTLADGLYNSGKELSIEDSIASAKDNPITIDRITKKINYNGICIMDEPHTLFQRFKTTLLSDLRWFSIEERMRYRPDAIAEAYYGTPDLWYLIMWANNVHEPLDLNPNAVQVIPMSSITRIIQLALDSQQEVNENEENIPIAEQSILVRL